MAHVLDLQGIDLSPTTDDTQCVCISLLSTTWNN
jgi:hypothetical protein